MSDSNTPSTYRKSALAPDLREMPDRTVRAWVERMAVRHLGGADYAVDSQSGATYVVDAREGTCTCPDATIRDETCKHQRRVALEITSRRVPPPGKRRVDCAACGTETFVPETSDPPALCGACRLEPGDVVLDRETGDRLVVVVVTGRRADEVPVEAADTTVADYPTNEGYPTDDIVVEVSYLTDAATGRARTYSFPHSRLQRTDGAELVDA
ncbi:SWIM zinc finger family protein [Salinibaculum rarum]|uniref:SWIM zinc finger family protein n=1 Tax=Salinibaculum rarum TaxID=3058903 RepID=UPI00265E7D33|nr:SWIM zinc finger family protein [Salinibaculum sp. KK48]